MSVSASASSGKRSSTSVWPKSNASSLSADGTGESVIASVLDRPLDGIDHDDLHESPLRVELESQLLLNRGEKRRAFFRVIPLQIEIESARQPRPVNDCATRQRGQDPGDVSHRSR